MSARVAPGPAVSAARLRIVGEVAAPQELDFAALRALGAELVEPSTLLAGRDVAAIRLETLLGLAGVNPLGRSIVAESTDGSFLTSLSLAAARGCVVVYRVGEAPLPRGLGGPFRLVTGGRVRCGDVKSLGTLYVSDREHVDDADTERICVRTWEPG